MKIKGECKHRSADLESRHLRVASLSSRRIDVVFRTKETYLSKCSKSQAAPSPLTPYNARKFVKIVQFHSAQARMTSPI